MKVQQFARGLFLEHHEPSSLTLASGCKRLRPLVPRLAPPTTTNNGDNNSITTATASVSRSVSFTTPFDLKSFIRPESGPRKLGSSDEKTTRDSPHHQLETHPGGTRWNPTQEQIGILEMLYRGGMRTPNAQQIEQITAQLGRYGKIEGKNVFYWFQNHKARERQKQKRNSLGLVTATHSSSTSSPRMTSSSSSPPSKFLLVSSSSNSSSLTLDIRGEDGGKESAEDSSSPYYKRKCRSWTTTFESREGIIDKRYNKHCIEDDDEEEEEEEEEEEGDRTLELFPLHPEGR